MSELAVNMFLKISIEKHLRPKTSRQNLRRKKAVCIKEWVLSIFHSLSILYLYSFVFYD